MRTHLTHRNGGFTLIEVVISISILVALATITVLSLGSFRENQALSNTVDAVIALSNQARSRTLEADGGAAYGVHLDANDIVLFAGPTYSVGAPGNLVIDLDPTTELDAISLEGDGSDVLFDPITGSTENDGTLVVRRVSTTAGERTLTISATGEISSD